MKKLSIFFVLFTVVAILLAGCGPKASVLKLYGQEVNLFKLGRMPAQVIVDKEGTARFVHYGHAMSDIPENAELLALLDEINNN
jgi:peroxiredoxin Q/BCP